MLYIYTFDISGSLVGCSARNFILLNYKGCMRTAFEQDGIFIVPHLL
jgi:hypothetical protein